jgi:hypothetical protein
MDTPVYTAITDACWTRSNAREEAMRPIIAAYSDWDIWGEERRKKTVKAIAILTVNRIIGEMEILPVQVRKQCRDANDLTAALAAAQDVGSLSLLEGNWRADDAEDYQLKRAAQSAADRAALSSAEAAWGSKRATEAAHEAACAAAHVAEVALISKSNPDDVLRSACKLWMDATTTGTNYSTDESKPEQHASQSKLNLADDTNAEERHPSKTELEKVTRGSMVKVTDPEVDCWYWVVVERCFGDGTFAGRIDPHCVIGPTLLHGGFVTFHEDNIFFIWPLKVNPMFDALWFRVLSSILSLGARVKMLERPSV